MADRSEVRAGLFVLTALAILAAGTLWIVGFSPMRGRQVAYEILMKSSGGVRRGDRVRVAGIEMGRVKGIKFRAGEEWPVVFKVSINERFTPVVGSAARITTDGLLGAPYLELLDGPAGAAPLPPGSEIQGVETGSFTEAFEKLGSSTEGLPDLLEEATELLHKINRELEPIMAGLQVVLSEENAEAISGTLGALQPTLEKAGPQLTALMSRLDSLASGVEEGVADVPELTSELNGLLADLRQAVGADGGRLIGVLDSAESTLGTAGSALSIVENNGQELDAMLRDLREAAANLRSLSQTLKERPALLLRYPRPPEGKTGDVKESNP